MEHQFERAFLVEAVLDLQHQERTWEQGVQCWITAFLTLLPSTAMRISKTPITSIRITEIPITGDRILTIGTRTTMLGFTDEIRITGLIRTGRTTIRTEDIRFPRTEALSTANFRRYPTCTRGRLPRTYPPICRVHPTTKWPLLLPCTCPLLLLPCLDRLLVLRRTNITPPTYNRLFLLILLGN
jgi:hypothetical protein